MFFPIAKDRLILYSDVLVEQTIYGTQIADSFVAKTEGLYTLISSIQKEAESGYITALDGRLLTVRSPHSAFNLLLQSAGAIFMKQYLYDVNEVLSRTFNYGDYLYVANIHDAINIECNPTIAERICNILRDCFKISSDKLNLTYQVHGNPKTGINQFETH